MVKQLNKLKNVLCINDNHTSHLTLLWSVFFVHMILRFAVLARVDAFGVNLVNKLEWYIFHAFAIDFIWISSFTLFFFLVSTSLSHVFKSFKTDILFWISFLFQIILLPLTVLDHEFMRFMGGHVTKNLIDTYGNTSSSSQLIPLIQGDQSIPFLPIILIAICIPLALVFYRHLVARVTLRVGFWLKLSIICFCVFWLYKNVFWGGTFRERRLKPVYSIIYDEATLKREIVSEKEIQRMAKVFQTQWKTVQADSNWQFPHTKFPFFKVPTNQLCSQLITQSPSDGSSSHMKLDNIDKEFWLARCQIDGDEDGFVLADDCSDWDSNVNPKGVEIPTNGIDEDCSGMDESPPNIMIFLLESHRALHTGFLKEWGATRDATPFLNELIQDSNTHYWTQFHTSGLPTIGAFSSMHLGIWDYSNGHTATSFPTLTSQSFIDVMKSKGYQTTFYSAADPAWDNKPPWLKRWYGGFKYDRKTEEDALMYQAITAWVKDSVQEPFVLASLTHTNHYPFNHVDGVAREDDATPNEKMTSTMIYTEESLKKMFNEIKDEPWFDRTLFVLMADHGFSTGEHGVGGVYGGLYKANTWLPLVIKGNHPKLRATLSSKKKVSSQVDLAPTFLDLLGIQAPNHFVGHSLFDSVSDNKKVYVPLANQGLIIDEDNRYYCHMQRARTQGEEVFDISDIHEDTNIKSSLESRHRINCEELQDMDRLNRILHETDRVNPKDSL